MRLESCNTMMIYGIILTDLSEISNAPVVFTECNNSERFYLAQTNYCDRIVRFVPLATPYIHMESLFTPIDTTFLAKKIPGPFLVLFQLSKVQGMLTRNIFHIGDEPPHLGFQFPYISVD